MTYLNDDHVCAGIAYGQVGSDICGNLSDPEWRSLLHKSLDEFLENYTKDGLFYVGDIEGLGD